MDDENSIGTKIKYPWHYRVHCQHCNGHFELSWDEVKKTNCFEHHMLVCHQCGQVINMFTQCMLQRIDS